MKLQARQQRQHKLPKIIYRLQNTLIPMLFGNDLGPNNYGQYTLIQFWPINEVDILDIIKEN
jgi:hypothetical protein